MFGFTDEPLVVQLTGESSSFWDSPAFTSIVTLAAAVVGGFAAYLIARYQTNAARGSDDRRQWGEKILELFHEMSLKSEPLFQVWAINNGDMQKLVRVEEQTARALSEVELAYSTLSIILPRDLPELEKAVEDCRRVHELVRSRDEGEARPTERMATAHALPERFEALRKALRSQIGITS